MLPLKNKLEGLERDKNPICIGVVGAGETDTGQKGSTLIEQIEHVLGITNLVVAIHLFKNQRKLYISLALQE